MDFADLLSRFTKAVEVGDGTALGECFTPDGIYHDTFYGEYTGRDAIKGMLEDKFHRDAKDFFWTMKDPVSDGSVGYSRWEYFGYTSTMAQSQGKKVVIGGLSFYRLSGGLIQHYSEVLSAGIAFAQLGMKGSSMERVFGKWAQSFTSDPDVAKALAN